jgi:hypothetical protein
MTDTTGLRGRPLAEAVLDVVEHQPSLHYQQDVTCGTQACIAGWAMALNRGYTPGDELDGKPLKDDGTLSSEAAYQLLFGEDAHPDGDHPSDQYLDFLERVFENPSESAAVGQLRGMLDRMPAGVTA